MKVPKYPDDFKDWDGVDVEKYTINSMIDEVCTGIASGSEFKSVSTGNILVEGDKNGIRICKIVKEWGDK